jgi:hypothetical protein
MAVPSTLTRTKVPAPSAEDGEIRVYFDTTTDTPPMPSVSVVKGLRVDPEKEDALEGWMNRYDGQSKWARPWWRDQRQFKALRGTIVHFAILSDLGEAGGNTYFHEVGDGQLADWGYEEYWAKYCLHKWSTKAPSANTDEVPYTPRNNEYDGVHAWDRAVRDTSWAASAFHERMMEGDDSQRESSSQSASQADEGGRLERDNVLEVEEFVLDREYGYAGQYDLLYETPDGRTVLSDLKTSSGVRFDHKLQSAAYKRAVEHQENIEIDECEIIRLHPDSETVEVSRSPEWDRTLDGLQNEFLGLVDRAHQSEYTEALQRAETQLLDERERTEQEELDAVVAD